VFQLSSTYVEEALKVRQTNNTNIENIIKNTASNIVNDTSKTTQRVIVERNKTMCTKFGRSNFTLEAINQDSYIEALYEAVADACVDTLLEQQSAAELRVLSEQSGKARSAFFGTSIFESLFSSLGSIAAFGAIVLLVLLAVGFFVFKKLKGKTKGLTQQLNGVAGVGGAFAKSAGVDVNGLGKNLGFGGATSLANLDTANIDKFKGLTNNFTSFGMQSPVTAARYLLISTLLIITVYTAAIQLLVIAGNEAYTSSGNGMAAGALNTVGTMLFIFSLLEFVRFLHYLFALLGLIPFLQPLLAAEKATIPFTLEPFATAGLGSFPLLNWIGWFRGIAYLLVAVTLIIASFLLLAISSSLLEINEDTPTSLDPGVIGNIAMICGIVGAVLLIYIGYKMYVYYANKNKKKPAASAAAPAAASNQSQATDIKKT
jgi:hypothetical protein